MHELSIASAIVSEVSDALAAHGGGRVTAVTVRVGRLSGIVPGALVFGFEVAREGTPLAGARLHVERVPIVVWCATCEGAVTLDEPRFVCPTCGSATPELLGGRELEIASFEMDGDVQPERQASEATP